MPRGRRAATRGLSWLLFASMLGAAALPAAVCADGQAKQAKHPQDDADLMEFLGSIGSADERWIDYLKRTDPEKVASTAKPPASSAGGSSDGASGGGQKK